MKFGRIVDLMGSRSSPILLNVGRGVSPQGQKSEKCRQFPLDSSEPGVTNWPVTTLRLVSHRWLGE